MLSAAGTAAIVKLQPTDADVKETEHKRDANRVDVIQSLNFFGHAIILFPNVKSVHRCITKPVQEQPRAMTQGLLQRAV